MRVELTSAAYAEPLDPEIQLHGATSKRAPTRHSIFSAVRRSSRSRRTTAAAGANDPLSRSSVVDAYFDGTERDSVLGTYAITEEGETTLEAPLGPYRVTAEGEIEPAPVDQVGG